MRLEGSTRPFHAKYIAARLKELCKTVAEAGTVVPKTWPRRLGGGSRATAEGYEGGNGNGGDGGNCGRAVAFAAVLVAWAAAVWRLATAMLILLWGGEVPPQQGSREGIAPSHGAHSAV